MIAKLSHANKKKGVADQGPLKPGSLNRATWKKIDQ